MRKLFASVSVVLAMFCCMPSINTVEAKGHGGGARGGIFRGKERRADRRASRQDNRQIRRAERSGASYYESTTVIVVPPLKK